MISLDAKTGYSFLRGYGTPEQWEAGCKRVGADALGIADYCSTWGHVPFSRGMKDVDILYGVQLPVVPLLAKNGEHALVTLLACEARGLKDIYEMVTLAHEQQYYRPRVTWKQLSDIKDTCVLIVNEAGYADLVDFDRLGFGYLGIGPRRNLLYHFHEDYNCVATGSPVFPSVDVRDGYELVASMQSGQKIGELGGSGFPMMKQGDYDGLISRTNGYQGDLSKLWWNNRNIAATCRGVRIPRAELPVVEGDLEALAEAGFKARGITPSDAYRERLGHELSVVRAKGFENYFLFVADLVQWAKARMLVGPARGSSGGSLLCYLLGITELDPLVCGLLFERFLDPTRSDLPDIDVDFPDVRREEVFGYLKEKYGEKHVARLGTVAVLGGKSAINDLVRSEGLPYVVGRDVGKAYEVNEPTLAEFVADPGEAKPLFQQYPSLEKLPLLEGVPRHHGVHAAGVCITRDEITNYGSVNGKGTISLDMHSAEAQGLLKMDALGLRTLSVLTNACEQINMEVGHLYHLPFDDPKVYEVFNKDLVTGVFQFEGTAVRGLMKQMEVETFDDLAALTSLARPGPLVGGAAAAWIARRSGTVEWDYQHPALREHTEETYGTIVYQEQAMSIVRGIGSFDVAEVNAFRKAVGKKDPIALRAFRDKFVTEGRNLIGDIVEDLWDEMCEFGSYAFNKSHAYAYSMITYYCAWFKAYYPVEFALAQMRNAADDDQAKALLRELSREGHKIVAFDIDKSEAEWCVKDKVLYGPFTSIKGVGAKTAALMLERRAEIGEGWEKSLTQSQYNKLTGENNTPWHDLTRMDGLYHELYASPLQYRSESLTKGVEPPLWHIADIPEEIGKYTFLGKLVRRQPREKLGADGKVVGEFCNLYFEDDSGQIGCTINRNKWAVWKWLLEDDYDGTDWIVKGNIINDGRAWIFIENMIQLTEDDRRPK